MVSTDPTTIARERNLAQRALELFVSVYGLEWSDSYRAAQCERTFGREYVAQVLAIVSATGRTFMDCALAVEAGDTAIPALKLYTAPLNGRHPAMVEAGR